MKMLIAFTCGLVAVVLLTFVSELTSENDIDKVYAFCRGMLGFLIFNEAYKTLERNEIYHKLDQEKKKL